MNKEYLIKHLKHWDWESYGKENKDLRYKSSSLLNHALHHGIKEGRKLKFDKNKNFLKHTHVDLAEYFNQLDNFFIIQPIFGLSIRLRAIASAYSICKELNKNLIINWIPDCHCDCKIEDIITNVNDLCVGVINNINTNKLMKLGVTFQRNYNDNPIIDHTKKKIYIESNNILNNEHSNKHINDFCDLFLSGDFKNYVTDNNYYVNNIVEKKENIEKYVNSCNTVLNLFKTKHTFPDNIYESSLSPNYRHVEEHILYNENKITNQCNISEYNNIVNEKLLTFVICIKNRNIRTNICLVNLINVCKNYNNQIDIILVEEKGHDLFIDKFNTFQHTNLKHIQVNEYDKNIFNKSRLLNIGMKHATTKYVAMYDCDFLTYNISPLIKTLSYYFHHNNLIFRCSLYESEAMNKKQKMQPYSYVWIYNKYIINQINYFNEDFENWGFEETDIASRILRNENKLIHIYNDFFHLSHSDNMRNKNNLTINEKIFKSNIIIPRNLTLVQHNFFDGKHLLFLNYNEYNEIFNDQDAIIYTPQSLVVVLINKDLFKCKIIGNITEIPFTDDVYNTFKSVNAIGFDTLPTWFKNSNNIGIVTPMFNQNEDIYNLHLSSIKKQHNEKYIHITIDSFSKPTLLYKFFEYNNPHSLFIQKKSKIVDAIKLGYKFMSKSISYWCWLNSDDELYDENTLHIVKEHMCKMNHSDLLYGKGLYVKENQTKNVIVCKEHEKNPIESLLTCVGICQPSLYMKSNNKKIEKCLIDLDESMVFDYELWIKLAFQHVQFKYIDHNLSKYNFTDINITGNNRTEQLYQTCCLVKKYYGFVPLDWIKRYSGSKLNNADGIWKNVTNQDGANIVILNQKFNSDAFLYKNINWDFIQLEFNKIKTLS